MVYWSKSGRKSLKEVRCGIGTERNGDPDESPCAARVRLTRFSVQLLLRPPFPGGIYLQCVDEFFLNYFTPLKIRCLLGFAAMPRRGVEESSRQKTEANSKLRVSDPIRLCRGK
jgi:hypothetical protein